MNNLSLMEIMVLSAALICIPLVTRAALEESKVIEGIVQVVQENKIVIAQSGDDKNSNTIDFQTQPGTTFEGVSKTDIKEGDKLRVGYHEDHDVYMADTVTHVK